ncbi:hydrolase [Aerococcus kribbianus]|uniref:Hydrolase n=1 Tax=Aerococcus kribbianus TaxID=2999064 RepID=A0A9X3FRV7_9LACT|nr:MULTISPECIES: hydrolase [unclassified Aerococcus]MCZ0717257.1 hydrolase [Aerococcus sp. YH-aer221]MCZ0725545.1 hydrolase [Aerococcus sp. YH-aer222]
MAKESPIITSHFRKDMIMVPEVINEASGIRIFGRTLKSFVFTTDVAIIQYCNADAVLAVYPFSPHPAIISAVSSVSSRPVFAGVGGGTTQGKRSVDIALFAEASGVMGVVVNVPMSTDNILDIEKTVDSPIVGTVVSAYNDIPSRLTAGVDILNVSGGKDTADIVRRIRRDHPDIPIIATGGKEEKSIKAVIDAGANAISWTPPTTAQIFKDKMVNYRKDRREAFIESHDGMTLNEYEEYVEEQNH